MTSLCRKARGAAATRMRLHIGLALMLAAASTLMAEAAVAQAQEEDPPATRAEAIERERLEKRAVLWPARQSPIVDIVNGFVERGLLDAATEGLGGGNGAQFVIGGMRSGQGLSLGVGYRRSDLWHDRIGFRATVRGTPQLAWMADGQFYFPRLYTERGFFDVYAKYEYSPQMDYYGEGPETDRDDRTSYRLEDFRLEFRGGWEFFHFLRIGGTAGGIIAGTGSGKRGGVPSIEEAFDPADVPGLFIDGDFFQAGTFVEVDYRDLPAGPRSGGHYLLEWRRYWDQSEADEFNFRRVDGSIEQYFPYWNKTRVVAIRLHGVWTFTDEGQSVPFYLQPTLGGNDDLRAFQRYRFHADNMFIGTIEHRWHGFAGMDVALFVDGGKVSNRARLLYREDLRIDGGIGFRFKFREAVIMRIDQAYGNEGYRLMWTFSNIF